MTYEEEVLQLKLKYQELIDNNIEVSGKHFNEQYLKRFPLLYASLNKEDRNSSIYNILFDIGEIPTCKTCRKPTSLKNFRDGYRKYCSINCANKDKPNDQSFRDNLSIARKTKYNSSYYLEKYSFVKDKIGENFLISGYCDHGEFWLNKNKFTRLIENNSILCEKCIEEIDTSEKEDVDISKFSNEVGFKFKHPITWKLMNENCKETDASFSEKRYMYLHKLSSRPLCEVCKLNTCNYLDAHKGYTITCNNYSCVKSTSSGEREVHDFCKTICDATQHNVTIHGHSIDIFIPDKNLAIEFNGLYWHSEKYRNKTYHQKKKLDLLQNGINLLHIWEDDWKNKKSLIKSMISHHLNKSRIIYARKCAIRKVDNVDEFLIQNHLQGTCVSKMRYGLFFDDQLVSVMTFGKGRMTMNSKNVEWELLRFCNCKNTTVIGGASKLFSYFMKEQRPNEVISYANLDISNGNLYRKLNFTEESITAPGYWWCKGGQKYNRSRFMKHVIAKTETEKSMTAPQIMKEQGYYVVWNSGNIKFKWMNVDI